MKTKTTTKQRKASREFSIENDLRGEFENVLDDSSIDELAMAEIEDWDD